MMDLVHDVLDKQLVDRNGVRMGRADGLIAELREGQLPRLVAIETGTIVIARRFGSRTEGMVRALLVKARLSHRTEPYRIAWTNVRKIGVDIQLDIGCDDTPVHDWQRWLQARVIDRLPGAR
ncbi:hypothetical protein [Caballeronia grimmiae]|nr:hypothetical protein [Caballeronia grimmiae]